MLSSRRCRFQVSSNPPPYPFVLRFAIESPQDFLHPLKRAGESRSAQESLTAFLGGRAGATSLRGFSWGRAGANIPPSIPKRVQSYYNFPRCPNLCTKYPASVITIRPKKQQKSVSYLADRLTHYGDSLCRKEKKYQQKTRFFIQNSCIYQFFVVSLYRVLKYEAPERQPTVRCSDEHPMTDYEIWDTGHPKTKNSPINN